MYDKVCALIQWRSNLAVAGRFDDLAREFVLPLVMYLKDRMVVVQNHDQLVAILERLQEVRRRMGVVQVLSDVTALEVPRQGRFRIWARHHQLDSLGRSVTVSDAIYYSCETPEGLRTAMAEFSTCTLTEIWDHPDAKRAGLRASGHATI